MKKVCVCILASSLHEKYLNRIKLIEANIIRSFNHKLHFHFLGEGARPNFLNPEWAWHDFSKYPIGDRHIYALIEKIANPTYDYIVFCDDDVAIDVDKFVKIARQYEDSPTVFTCHPGINAGLTPMNEIEAIKLYTPEYIKNRNINEMWMGFTTSIINKKLCEKIFDDQTILNKMIDISQFINHNAAKFICDVQICILAWLMEAHVVQGLYNGASCWPAFGSSSIFMEDGDHYHIHHTTSSRFVSIETLTNVLKKAPFKFYEDLISELFPIFQNGVNIQEWDNKTFTIKYFWAPWSYFGVINNICYEQEDIETKILLKDNYSKYKDGFILHRNPVTSFMDQNMFDINFMWTYENYIIGVPIRKKEINFFNQFENSVILVGIKD